MKRKEFVTRMRDVLRKRREALVGNLSREMGQLSAVEPQLVGDSADAAVDTERDLISSQLAAVESRELAAIDDALARMRSGHYGKCENCDTDIPVARLQALPYASMCVKCQRESERESATRESRGGWAPQVGDEDTTNGSFGSVEFEHY